MLEKGKTYAYFYNKETRGSDVTIEQIHNGEAIATSGSFADMGPFSMHFDVNTGMGLRQYAGTHLEELS